MRWWRPQAASCAQSGFAMKCVSLHVKVFNCRDPAGRWPALLQRAASTTGVRCCALPCSSPKRRPEAPAGGGLEARLDAHTPVHGSRRDREARVGADAGAGELLRTWEVGGGRQGGRSVSAIGQRLAGGQHAPLACPCSTCQARYPAQLHLQKAAEQQTEAHLPLGCGGVVACLDHEVLLAATH